ncbi:ABC-F family ATP-binding cassette domain-containing protein [Streptomyces zagrosensis]|uniref:ATPase subunit of ABC transporter with duplicated ATPase domains n=1 Tax=Streptomyces zagrosensis TaxID=1042984 RepID=A0A7W9QBS7_9ACTN|nr:ABC-F family ATP-binding cassette domain-containing protein [Streptomyces zagrosensis]MBB5937250.1 ATPase subunit of ABC transporter with duplicated ATPase domains [Streptomyces zagrosensis]
MTATLVAKNLAAGHGDRTLFSGLNLVVSPGDTIGLVGANGAGKSTLLRILAGLAEPEEGSVTLSPPHATIGHLPQEHERRRTGGSDPATGAETVRDFLARRTGVAAAQAALDAATEALVAERPGADDAYSLALERWLSLGSADLDERADEVTASLGLAVGLDRPMTALSGGQAARAGLASLLLSRYDVFLLDEPTNDLDLDGLGRLESFVSGLRAGTVLVSHDREFLARTVDKVLELDLAQQQVTLFGGGYTAYLEERETARRHAKERYEQYADTRASLEARARTQRAWMDKGVKNARRKAPDGDKILRNARVESTEKQAAKARQTERLIERLDEVDEPRKEWELHMEIAAAPRSGSVVATLRSAEVERGSFHFGPVDLQIDWADRVAIVGVNGSGKTTLLAALLGRLPLDAGYATLGSGVVVGEVDQARAQLFSDDADDGQGDQTHDGRGGGRTDDAHGGHGAGRGAPDSAAGPASTGPQAVGRAQGAAVRARARSLLDTFGAVATELEPAEVRTLLAKFGLKAEHVLRPAHTLSPGERTRAALALLQARGVNLLVLDEPTNHLDLPAIEQLESALATYDGTLLLVTHDRRMLDAVQTTRRIEVADGRVTER